MLRNSGLLLLQTNDRRRYSAHIAYSGEKPTPDPIQEKPDCGENHLEKK